MKKIIGSALTLICIVLSPLAHACSCFRQESAGFIHSNTKILPANAKGVLFLDQFNSDVIHFERPGVMILSRHQPKGLRADDFEIINIKQQERIPANIQTLHPFDLNANPEGAFYVFNTDKLERDFLKKKSQNNSISRLLRLKLIRKLNESNFENLVRVSPAKGFKIGQTYSVRYLGKTSNWAYPTAIEVTIDGEELDMQKKPAKLNADGEVRIEAIQQATQSGMCSSIQVSQVQRLSLPFDSQMEKFKDAMLIFPKTSVLRLSPYFMMPEIGFHSPSLCGQDNYGKTSSTDQHEILVARCEIEPQEVVVNALVGFLEVEDNLRLTNSIHVAFKKIPTENCNGFHLIDEALNTANIDRLKVSLCALQDEESRWNQNVPKIASVPNVSAIWNLRNSFTVEEKQCLTAFLERVIIESKETPIDAIGFYKESLISLLRSNDPGAIAQAESTFRNLDFGLSIHDTESSAGENRKQELLHLLKPDLLSMIEHGSLQQAGTAGSFLGELRTVDQATIDRLFVVLTKDHSRTRAVSRTLALIAPNEPRLHEMLIAQTNDPALLENASSLYADVAGKQNPKKAIVFLVKAIVQGSREAISRLPEFKDDADAAIPSLVEILTNESSERRNEAFRILIQLYRGQAEIIHALKQSLRLDSHRDGTSLPIYHLRDLGKDINLFKPEIEQLSGLPMSELEKESLKQLVKKLDVSTRDKNKMMRNLETSSRTGN